ncbi:MAG: DUF975 family protein [Patescibacteria group bacterium]|nr:DUF975 family protein [Patescibacteria group bacterium]
MSKFSKKEAIKYGWEKTIKNLRFFIILALILFSISFIPSFINAALTSSSEGGEYVGPATFSLILNFAFWVLQMVVGIGLIKIYLRFIDSQEAKYSDLFSYYRLFFKYLAGSILSGLIVFAGFILLIVPGIIWAIKYQFVAYLIVDKNMGPIEALKNSGKITKGVKWNLFLFGLLLGLINIAGMLALGIGLFLTIPTTMLATAYVYRKLSP